ncbi:hypothetical protein NLJ89_g5395 [Agrocybe chaxingu]|uniref:F-box domain-containing protein n=1 Tax=Agrocybe chaxingu TaxID=84603 RepID=A0A9W8K140_9AGAR|nr:hypothetical protein NLJ89_g5395 [Agrocybe chaxingu]
MASSNPFLSLAPELIQTIGDELSMSDLKQLRLTCKQLQPLVNHQLFRTVMIDITINNIKKSVDMLQLLATGDCNTRGSRADLEAQSATEQVAGCLRDALRSFSSLTTIRWSPVQWDNEEVQIAVVEALVGLSTLKNLHLNTTNCKAALPVDKLKGLEEISIFGLCSYVETMDNVGRLIARSPGLRSLKVAQYRNYGKPLGKAQSLHQLLEYCDPLEPLRLRHLSVQEALVRLDHITLPHLRSLTSLELTSVCDPFNTGNRYSYYRSQDDTGAAFDAQKVGSSTEDIWKAFASTGVRLEKLKHDSLPRSLLKYLSSYSGLKSLNIAPTHFDSAGLSDAAATEFFFCPSEQSCSYPGNS